MDEGQRRQPQLRHDNLYIGQTMVQGHRRDSSRASHEICADSEGPETSAQHGTLTPHPHPHPSLRHVVDACSDEPNNSLKKTKLYR